MMHHFDDHIPYRAFDNFQVKESNWVNSCNRFLSMSNQFFTLQQFFFMQFVNFTEIMSKHISASQKEAEFALAALMEIPSQYKATMELQLLGYCHQHALSHMTYQLGNDQVLRMVTFLLSFSRQRGTPGKLPLPPPVENTSASSYPKHIRPSSNEHSNRYGQGSGFDYASSPYTEHSSQNRVGFCVLYALTHTCLYVKY